MRFFPLRKHGLSCVSMEIYEDLQLYESVSVWEVGVGVFPDVAEREKMCTLPTMINARVRTPGLTLLVGCLCLR